MYKRTYRAIYYMSWTMPYYQNLRWRFGLTVGNWFLNGQFRLI